MSKNTAIILGIIVIILIIGGVFIFKGSSNSVGQPADQQVQNTNDVPPTDTSSTGTPDSGSASANPASVKEFTVTGSNFKFDPPILTVNIGDTVKITFKNSGGMHDFVIDEFNVKTPLVKSGEDALVQFTADKTGTFQYYCNVANHRAMGMQGNLIVQ